MAERKSDQARLDDALEALRKKEAELQDYRKTIRVLRTENDTAENIRSVIWKLAEHNPEPPAWLSGKGGKIGSRGVPITIWSDIHYGEVIEADQVNGVNVYNKSIAKKRLLRLYDTTVDLCYNHMGRAKTEYPGIIVCLGGDMIGGDIHEELMQTNDRTPLQAVNDLTDILAAGIEHMASKFGKVFVPCVVGNHGRTGRKLQAKNRVFTSYEWSLYCNLARHFAKEKFIHIDVPNSADAHFQSYGVRFMLSHGDSLGVKGGDGIIGAIGPIMRGNIKLGKSQHSIGQEFDELLLCHWHQMLWLPHVTVNNSLKGYDEYAMLGLRAPYSRPSQALFFNHPEHGTTARWEIYLEGRQKASEAKPWVTWQP